MTVENGSPFAIRDEMVSALPIWHCHHETPPSFAFPRRCTLPSCRRREKIFPRIREPLRRRRLGNLGMCAFDVASAPGHDHLIPRVVSRNGLRAFCFQQLLPFGANASAFRVSRKAPRCRLGTECGTAFLSRHWVALQFSRQSACDWLWEIPFCHRAQDFPY